MSSMARKLRLANTLVAAQVAFVDSAALRCGSVTRTLINLKNVDTGMRVEQLLIFGVNPDSKRYTESQLQSLYRSLQERLLALPGVSTVSYTSHPLLSGGLSSTDVRIEGRSDLGEVQLQIVAVGPDFLKTMGMTLLRDETYAMPISQTLIRSH